MSSSPVDGGAEVTDTKRRRSGRVPKKPEFLASEQPASAKRKRAGPDEEADGADGFSSDDEEGAESEDGEPDEEELREKRSKKTQGAPKRPAAKKPKTTGPTTSMPIRSNQQKAKRSKKKAVPGAVTDVGDVGGLYAEVFSGDKSMEEVVGEWLQRFSEHESGALAEIITFVLKCCGSESEVTNYDIEDVDAVTNKLGDLQDELLAQNLSDYPIITRTKTAAVIKNGIEEFFTVFIKTLDATDTLTDNPELIENVEAWLSTMTGAQSRPFRLTATVASLSIMTTLAEIGRDTAAASATSRRQSENMSKAKGGNKKRASGLLKDAEKTQRKQALVDALLKDWFDTIYIHRWRDVEPRIRVECAHALGDWLLIYPDVFFESSYLRYLGWELSDQHWPSRAEVIKQLTRLYEKRERLAGLKSYTERFRSRIVEIACLDSEASVRASTIHLLNILRQAGYLEPDDIDNIGRLIFDSEPRVRKAVVDFFSASADESYDGKIEDLGGDEAIREELDESADSTERPGLPWLRLKCLVELLDSYDSIDPAPPKHLAKGPGRYYRLQAGDVESRFITVAETLYPHIEALHHWETLATYLLFDTSGNAQNGHAAGIESQFKDACVLSEREQYILLEVLNVSLRQHAANLAEAGSEKRSKKTKKQRDQLADEQESAARQITTLMPKLLSRFGDSPKTALAVLRLERIVSLDAFADFQQDPSTSKQLIDDIGKQILSHGDEEVLNEASQALLRTKQYQDLGDVTEEKIEEIWEETLETFRRLLPKKDVQERGNLAKDALEGLSKTVMRLEQLAQISDPTTFLQASSQASKSQKSGKAASKSTILQALTSIIHRAQVEADTTEDPTFASQEDSVALHAAKLVGFHLLWLLSSLRKEVEESFASDETISDLVHSRDAYLTALTTVIASRRPSDSISLDLVSLLLDTHTSSAVLRQANPVDGASTSHIALVSDVSSETLNLLLRVFTAAEQRFATKTNRTIEKARDEDPARRLSKKQKMAAETERPLDAEPMDEDEDDLARDPEDSSDEESDAASNPPSLISDDESASEPDEEADEESQTQRREARRAAAKLQSQLLAEKALCELGAKLVLAVLAGVVDEKRVRKRLEINRAKLGPNWREVVKYLDSAGGQATRGRKDAAKKGPGKKEKEVVREEIVVSSSDEEEEGEEGEEEEAEEERGVEEQAAEVESLLAD